MAIQAVAGFDAISSDADANSMNGWKIENSFGYTGFVQAGRLGGNSILLNRGVGLFKTLVPQTTNLVGYALKGLQGDNTVTHQFMDSSEKNYITMLVNNSGVVSVVYGNPTSSDKFSASYTIPSYNPADWHYYEFLMTVAPAGSGAGVIKVWIDDILAINLPSGVNTNDPNSSETQPVYFTLFNNGTTTPLPQVDDFYAASAEADRVGPCRVQTLTPVAASGTPQWTPSSGTNVGNVNSLTPDGDSTYNSSATPGQVDMFTNSGLNAATATVKAVAATVLARKDDAGTRTIATAIKSGGTTATGSAQALQTTYSAIQGQVTSTDPATGGAWTVAAVNAATFGYSEVA